MTEYTIDQYILQLLFAEYQTAESRSWWQAITLDEAYQTLPRYEAEYLENILERT
jgi:hypothetical protein